MDPQDIAEIVHRHRAAFVGAPVFELGVLAELSKHPAEAPPPVADRRFRDVRLDSLDTLISVIVPRVILSVADHLAGGRLALDLEFRRLADFEPEALLARVPPWAQASERLAASQDPAEREQLRQRLAAQLDAVLHAEPLRELEATWRGLHHLLSAVPDVPGLRVRVLDISRSELDKTIARYKGSYFSEGPIFRRIEREGAGSFGGRPFNLLVADFAFAHTARDVDTLRDLARTAEAANCVFMAAVAPRLLALPSFFAAGELREPRRLLNISGHTAWRSLREDAAAQALALVLLRVLARSPYDRCMAAWGGERYVEDDRDPAQLPWVHGVHHVAARLFTDLALRAGYAGLPDAPTGGAFEAPAGLPRSDGRAVEGRFHERVADELENEGLMVLSQARGSSVVQFTSAYALGAGRHDALAWRMLGGHLLHGLRDLARHLRGSLRTPSDYEQALGAWAQGFVTAASAVERMPPAQAPLLAAQICVEFQDTRYWGNFRSPVDGVVAMAIVLKTTMHPLRPGRREASEVRAWTLVDLHE